jgi:hypothetical protein
MVSVNLGIKQKSIFDHLMEGETYYEQNYRN